MTHSVVGKLLAALRRFSKMATPMEEALAKLAGGHIGPDIEREYETAKQNLGLAMERVRRNIPGGRLPGLVDSEASAATLLALAAYAAEGTFAAAWQRELGPFRTLVDCMRRSISLAAAIAGNVSAVPPLPDDRESLQAIIEETSRYADVTRRYRAARLAILKLSQTPGAQEECDAAYAHLDSIRGERLRSEAYPEIEGRYPSFDVLYWAYNEMDEVAPLAKQAVASLDVAREYLYDDDLPQHPSEMEAARQAGDDVFDKVVRATDQLNVEARLALSRLDGEGEPLEPFDPDLPTAKPLPASRPLLEKILAELTAHLRRLIPVREAYAERKRLQRSPEVQQAFGLITDGIRRIVSDDVPMVSLERIEASCPEVKRVRDLTEFIDAFFRDYQAKDPLVLSLDYLETARNRTQLRAMLDEVGPDGDFAKVFIKPLIALQRKIMDELAKPAEDIAEWAAIDDPIYDALRRAGEPLTTGPLLNAINSAAAPGRKYSESTLKKRLADLVKLGRLTNKPDSPGRGYYLAGSQSGS